MSCDLIDTLARETTGIRLKYDDKVLDESELMADVQIDGQPLVIDATDGYYPDAAEALKEKYGIEVNGAKFIRIDLQEPAVYNGLYLADSDGDGKVSESEAALYDKVDDAIRQAFFSQNADIKDLSILIHFPNITRLPSRSANGIWSHQASDYTNLEIICTKWIKFWDTEYSDFPKLTRLVLPSLLFPSQMHSGGLVSDTVCKFIDCGPNFYKWSGTTGVNRYNGTVILRRTAKIGWSGTFNSSRIYVPENTIEDYRLDENWNLREIFPIGGPTWVTEFGSSDPYADLTDEERSWYGELFPDLYKDWTPPVDD